MAKGASAEKAVRESRRKTRRAISPLDEERVKLEHYYTPWELERAVARFVEHYNHRRVHESSCNVTPADMYAGRQQAILCRRERIKREMLQRRRRENLGKAA